MGKIKISDLPPVAKTLLIPLSFRVVDNRRPDPMVKDTHVLELADRIEDDVAKFAKGQGIDKVFGMMRVRQFDKHEPRLGIYNSLKFIPFLRDVSLVLRYKLGF